jgi:hypothetical protein
MIPQFVHAMRGPNDIAAGYSFPQSTAVLVNREQLRFTAIRLTET